MSRNADGLGRKPHRWRDRWRAYVTAGYKLNGDPERVYVYGRTEAECLAKVDEVRKRVAEGQDAKAPPDTLNAWLDDWLETKELEVKPRTLEIYKADLRQVRHHLGRRRLAKLTPRDIQAAMRAIVGTVRTYQPNPDKPKAKPRRVTLTAKTANSARATLATALEDAVSLGLIPSNPASKVRAFKHEPKEIVVWSAAEIVRFTNTTIAAAADYHALFYLALTAGLRPGELIALEWDDLTGEHLRVQRTASVDGRVGPPKTKAGLRTLPLSADTLATLEQHYVGLEQAHLLDRLVFPTATATMVTHSNLRRSLHIWARHAEVTLLAPHGLRHTYASMAISSGMDVGELSWRLGHTSPAFTLSKYVQFFERMKPREAPTLAELLGQQDRAGVLSGGTSVVERPN